MNLDWQRVNHPNCPGYVARDRDVEPSTEHWFRVGDDASVAQHAGHKGPWITVDDAATREIVLSSLHCHLNPPNPLRSVLRCIELLEYEGQQARFYGWRIPHEEEESMTICPFTSREDREQFVRDIAATGADERAAAFAALAHWGEESLGERAFWRLTNDYPHQLHPITDILDRYQDYKPKWERALLPVHAHATAHRPLTPSLMRPPIQRGR